MNKALEAFKKVLDDVEETERTNTRNSYTDYRCRKFFVDHGSELLIQLLNKEGKA